MNNWFFNFIFASGDSKRAISTINSQNHAFSTGTFKVPSNSSKTNHLASVSAIDLVGYSTPSKTAVPRPTQTNAADIFGGSQSTVIDFNEVAAASVAETDQKASDQPLMKKRKITIISAAEKVPLYSTNRKCYCYLLVFLRNYL